MILPFIAYWVGVTRQVLGDHGQLAAIIDGRLRRGLGMSIDDQIATALADDDGIAEASDGDLGAAIRVAVGQLAAAGYFGDTTVLIAPEDLPAAGILGDLPLLGVTAVIPSAGLPAGTAITADLRAAVQVRYHGTARISTTDSHLEQFLTNEITLLAEQRALGAVADPAAAVKATAGAARTAAPAAPRTADTARLSTTGPGLRLAVAACPPAPVGDDHFAPGSPTEGGHARLLRYVPAHPSPCSNTPGPRRVTPRGAGDATSGPLRAPPGRPPRAPAPCSNQPPDLRVFS